MLQAKAKGAQKIAFSDFDNALALIAEKKVQLRALCKSSPAFIAWNPMTMPNWPLASCGVLMSAAGSYCSRCSACRTVLNSNAAIRFALLESTLH